MTFLSYITSTLPHAVGRTPIGRTLFIHGMCLIFLLGWRWSGNDPWAWTLLVLPLIILAGFWISTYRNYMGDRATALDLPDVCTDGRPLAMRDGTPIVCMLRWWAARQGISQEEAAREMEEMAYGEQYEAWRMHQQYLRERGLH